MDDIKRELKIDAMHGGCLWPIVWVFLEVDEVALTWSYFGWNLGQGPKDQEELIWRDKVAWDVLCHCGHAS